MKIFLISIFTFMVLNAVELVEVKGIELDMRYASDHNFVGSKIDGYNKAKCLLTPQAYKALQDIESELNTQNLSLLIYDCYRPKRAVAHFVSWASDLNDTKMKKEFYPNVKKSELISRGYIASRSSHSRGSTVDLTIKQLDFGSPFDYFDFISHIKDKTVPKNAIDNRDYLQEIMDKHGFNGYSQEWWHFTLDDEPNKSEYLDIPID